MMDELPLHARHPRQLDPLDLDGRMQAVVEFAEGEDGKPRDLCLREAMDGLDWLKEEDVQALCLAGARGARQELLRWVAERDADLAGRLRALLSAHGFA